ncbi:imidazole glycerol phosphate synthase subunit HisH [Buchnera aphidicola (Thelaxes californica)]|uniref:Imidazole glycerol phosphate synthase subunit HisH n=1 Tax=Buchnera aphidicola (Thelaxes californica) TaxID=1315998 RepID=A0A4D6YJI6_9GAMM|nr:imidazole glycerol phosphate synthase subunit HisH [Buchnera aphidicola]QCI26641.1 imidazole glycerol phosphate synthase subunit HisH [Buchnera aphidicola (Thelaxes californica)]
MSIVIVDTHCANLASLKWAILKLGYTVEVTNNPSIILNAKKIILPGVGTAREAMKQLTLHNLSEALCICTQPVLGICLGMQLFGSFSSEGGIVKGLNIINSSIRVFKKNIYPIPHMGWNTISIKKKCSLLKGITNMDRFYFVHSYIFPMMKYTLASTYYGEDFSSIIHFNNFYGVQFHPEKSGVVGSIFLRNFLEL